MSLSLKQSLGKDTFGNQVGYQQPEKTLDKEEQKTAPTDAFEPKFEALIHTGKDNNF